MKNTKLIWIKGSEGDYLALRDRLNRLAADGWELEPPAESAGMTCYLAKFHPTSRSELRYDVEPRLFCTEEELRTMVEMRAAEGWEAVCTVNGVNIYQSMPCRVPKFSSQTEEHRKSLNWMLSARAVSCLLIIALTFLWNLRNPQWYLSNLSVFAYFSFSPLTIVGVYLSFWSLFRIFHPTEAPASPSSYRLRCAGMAFLSLWRWGLVLSVLFTLLPTLWAAGVVMSVVLLRLVFRFTEPLCTGCALLLALLLSLMIPVQDISAVSGMAWRSNRTDIVTAERLNLDEKDLIFADYEKNGSFLVKCASYSEKREDIRIESRVYSCLTESLARKVEQDLHDSLSSYTVHREGKQTAALWTSGDLSGEQLDAVLAKLLP